MEFLIKKVIECVFVLYSIIKQLSFACECYILLCNSCMCIRLSQTSYYSKQEWLVWNSSQIRIHWSVITCPSVIVSYEFFVLTSLGPMSVSCLYCADHVVVSEEKLPQENPSNDLLIFSGKICPLVVTALYVVTAGMLINGTAHIHMWQKCKYGSQGLVFYLYITICSGLFLKTTDGTKIIFLPLLRRKYNYGNDIPHYVIFLSFWLLHNACDIWIQNSHIKPTLLECH